MYKYCVRLGLEQLAYLRVNSNGGKATSVTFAPEISYHFLKQNIQGFLLCIAL